MNFFLFTMKTNFKSKSQINHKIKKIPQSKDNFKNLSKKEFEEFVSNAGAAGSFMIFRSKKKTDELGLDNL